MKPTNIPQLRTSVGLLLLRLTGALSFACILVASRDPDKELLARNLWLLVVLSICNFAMVCGLFSRSAAGLAAIIWAALAYIELRMGSPWFGVPVRGCELVFVFAALALAGPGRFSVEYWLIPLFSMRRRINAPDA